MLSRAYDEIAPAAGLAPGPLLSPEKAPEGATAPHLRLPQKRWMRVHASSSAVSEVA